MGNTTCSGIETHVLFWTPLVTELIQYNCDDADEGVGKVWHVLDNNGDKQITLTNSGDDRRDDAVVETSLSDQAFQGQLRAYAGENGFFRKLELPALLASWQGRNFQYEVSDADVTLQRSVTVMCGSNNESSYVEIQSTTSDYGMPNTPESVAVYRVYASAMSQFPELETRFVAACALDSETPVLVDSDK